MQNKKRLPQRLPQRFYELLKVIKNPIETRIIHLKSIKDYSMAILLKWNKFEALLKLLKYYDKMESISNELNFINKNWKILKNLVSLDKKSYDLVLEKEKSDSLWNVRNKIVHLNFEISEEEFNNYNKACDLLLNELENNLQPKEKYLEKYRKLNK